MVRTKTLAAGRHALLIVARFSPYEPLHMEKEESINKALPIENIKKYE